MYPNYPQQPPSNQSNIGFNSDILNGPPQPSYPPYQSNYPASNYNNTFNSNNNYNYPTNFDNNNYSSGSNYNSYNNYDSGFSLPPPQPQGPSLNPYHPPVPASNSYYNNYDNSYNQTQPSYNNSFDSFSPQPPPRQPPSVNSNFNNYDNSYNSSQPPAQIISTGYNPLPSSYNTYDNPQPSIGANNSIYPTISNFNQQPSTYYEGTLKPFLPFNPTQDAERLYRAMKGLGTDEATLIDVLCKRTAMQRLEIASCFKTSYGKDLLKKLKDETSGNFELLFKALIKSPIELECETLKEAMQGLGTKESAVIDVMCTKTNTEMIELKNHYRRMYNKDLMSEVSDETSGFFKRLLVSLATANRSNNPPDYGKAVQQANELYSAGVQRLGTDEVTFNRIFASESISHLRVVFDEYKKKTNRDIEHAINSEMSGDVKQAFLALVDFIKSPPRYFARRLYESMAGSGTRDRALIHLVVSRSEIDMIQIKQEFQQRYNKSLESFIKGDCSGDYKRGLLCLVGDMNWKR